MAEYGIDRFVEELAELGFDVYKTVGSDNNDYALIRNFKIPLGRFAGRIIELGFQIPKDYPRLIHPSIHVKASPQLLEHKDSIANVRNIIESKLGNEWRYWSFRLSIISEKPALNIINQTNGIFYKI